jgi:hypothetical protein
MPTPFPGMDPYLEHLGLWPDVHNGLIAELRNTLAPQLRPRYYVALEERTYLAVPAGLTFVSRPDVTVVGALPLAASPAVPDAESLSEVVDLNDLLHLLYTRASYDLRINYRAQADPPLTGEDAAWADTLLRAAGCR